MLSFLKKDKVLDRLFVNTSSWESNKPLFDFLRLPIDKEDVCDPDLCAKDSIDDIISKATQETKEYDEYHHKMRLHKQMKSALKNVKSDRDFGNFDPALLMAAYEDDVVENPPQHKWNGRRPVLAVFVDDAQSSPLFRSSRFLNLCIRHRHVGSSEKTRMGVSMFICVQNYTAQHGGIPKAIRDNVSTMRLYLLDFLWDRCLLGKLEVRHGFLAKVEFPRVDVIIERFTNEVVIGSMLHLV